MLLSMYIHLYYDKGDVHLRKAAYNCFSQRHLNYIGKMQRAFFCAESTKTPRFYIVIIIYFRFKF